MPQQTIDWTDEQCVPREQRQQRRQQRAIKHGGLVEY
jgi:hypothetical protein